MKWITRRNLHIDRTASAWLIKRWIDPDAEFEFVAPESDMSQLDGRTFDIRGGEFSHGDAKCTFQQLVERHGLDGDPALVQMGRLILDADVPPRRTRHPESAGLEALLRGFQLSVSSDQEKLKLTGPVYDALYAYCQARINSQPKRTGTPRPALSYRRRLAAHLNEEA